MRAAALLKLVGQSRDFVAPFDLDSSREIAGTQRFDADLQTFQPAGDPARERKCGDRNGERDAAKDERYPPIRKPRLT